LGQFFYGSKHDSRFLRFSGVFESIHFRPKTSGRLMAVVALEALFGQPHKKKGTDKMTKRALARHRREKL
jgi:hypothetical protein